MMNRIKEIRSKKGITQSELASYLGIAQNTLSYWENGKFDIDNVSLCKIADYFQVSVDYLLGRDRDLVDTKDTLSLEEKQLIKKYRLLDPYGQKAVNHMLDIEYERCSPTEDPSENQQVLSYVARTGERGTITKSKAELDEIFSELKPDTSEQY